MNVSEAARKVIGDSFNYICEVIYTDSDNNKMSASFPLRVPQRIQDAEDPEEVIEVILTKCKNKIVDNGGFSPDPLILVDISTLEVMWERP